MRTPRTSSRRRSRSRALLTVACTTLVFAAVFGQTAVPAIAGGPSLTMGQVDTGSGAAGDGSTAASATRTVDRSAAPVAASLTGGDVSLDFIADGHLAYDHATGVGGTYADRTISPTGVEESLEGHDFACGDKIVYFTAITVDQGAGHGDVELKYSWDGTTTSGSRVGINDLVSATLNSPDSGNDNLDGNESVSITSETGGAPNGGTNGQDVHATIQVTNLDGGEQLILRLVTNLWCDFTETHVTGNIHANLDSAKVVGGSAIPVGQQTVPLKQAGDILFPGLNVLKSCPATGSVGEQITYEITVENTGQDQLKDVTVDDSILGDLSASYADTLAAGASETHSFPYTLTANPDPITNTVTAQATAAQSSTTLTDTTDCTTDVLFPDLQIQKQADDATVSAGDPIGYTVTVTNNGPGTAFDVVMHDTLPANPGLSWSVASKSGGWDCGIAAGTLTCGGQGFDLGSGDNASVHITSPTTSATCGTVSNTGSADASNTTQVSTGVVTIHVDCASLEISKVADDATVSAGDDIGYTITVTNSGAGTAKDVVVTDALPTNAGLSWSIDGGTGAAECGIAGGTLTCQFGDMGSGDSFTVHLTSPTTAATCDQVVNAASATTSNDGNPTTGPVAITVDCPDISVVKTADAGAVDAADQVGFLITVSNAGPGVAADVHLDDALPTNAGLSWSVDGGTGAKLCQIAQGSLACDFGDMAAGDSYTVHITSDTDATTCGQIDNTATATVGNGDGDQSSASITVNCPDLGIDIEKTGPALAHVGDTITYDFTVQLTTDEPLGDIVVTDANCNEGAPVYVSGDDGNGWLEPGEVWSYTCTHLVLDADLDPLPNTAAVSGTADDGRSTTDEDSWSVDLIHPAIQIVKEVNPQSGNPGDTVTYTYTVTNTGDATLYDISVDDDVIGHIGRIAQLDAGDSVTLTKDWELPSGEPTVTNVGTATGTDVLGKTVTADDDATVTIVRATHEHKPPVPPTAFTGSDALRLGMLTLVLLGLGSLALLASRRRRSA
jgi:uncharacterized repeat protein (TIGR01451 family)